jgi:hypothetical protein
MELPVELATVQYSSHTQITEIAFRVYGGKDHLERLSAANQALEGYTDYFLESENTVVSVDSYECQLQFTESGTPFVLFTYGNFQHSF